MVADREAPPQPSPVQHIHVIQLHQQHQVFTFPLDGEASA
jgi:hypothetical protein